MAKSAKELREQAKKLMEQAKEVEKKQAEEIGLFVLSCADKKWEGCTLETIKKEVEKIRG